MALKDLKDLVAVTKYPYIVATKFSIEFKVKIILNSKPQNPIPLDSFSIHQASQGEAESAERREKGPVPSVGQRGIVSDKGKDGQKKCQTKDVCRFFRLPQYHFILFQFFLVPC